MEIPFVCWISSEAERAPCLPNLLFIEKGEIIELTSKQKGNLTELQCITAFYKLGYTVSIPYGENSRYDFIADINGKLLRVQVKTSTARDNGDLIEFSCRSTRVNTQGNFSRTYTKEEIDYFCTYYDNKCYLVPVTECSSSKKLRFNSTKNGQKVGINLAEDYELEKQLEKLEGQ